MLGGFCGQALSHGKWAGCPHRRTHKNDWPPGTPAEPCHQRERASPTCLSEGPDGPGWLHTPGNRGISGESYTSRVQPSLQPGLARVWMCPIQPGRGRGGLTRGPCPWGRPRDTGPLTPSPEALGAPAPPRRLSPPSQSWLHWAPARGARAHRCPLPMGSGPDFLGQLLPVWAVVTATPFVGQSPVREGLGSDRKPLSSPHCMGRRLRERGPRRGCCRAR